MADCLIRLGDFDAADAMLAQELVVSGKSESSIAGILFLQAMLNDRRGDHDRADKIFFDIAERFGASPLNQSAVAQLLLRTLAELDRDSVGAPEERIALLAHRYPRAAAACGRAHLQILRYFAQRGMVERARRTLEQIGAIYEKNAALQAEAKTIAAEMYLGKRKKQQAIDLLNQAVSVHEPSQASWRAWLGLADIYEHDRNFGDAMTIYRKVYEESPRTAAVRWDARIRMGEIARMASFEEDPHSIFKSVVKSGQPFALPRLVAQFYAGEISTEMFAAQWRQMEKDSPLYLYHIARKALMEGEWAPSQAYFGKYLKELSPDSWEYVKAYALKAYTERR
jgi:tetratricopeptide (TPR) repeat protein